MLGYTVVDPASVITTHLSEVIRSTRRLDPLAARTSRRCSTTSRPSTRPWSTSWCPELLTLGEVQKVLQNLLRERVSIRDLVTILEALADHARADPRHGHAHRVCAPCRVPLALPAVPRHGWPHLRRHRGPAAGARDVRFAPGDGSGAVIAWPPQRTQRFLHKLGQELERMAAGAGCPGALFGPIRLPLRRLTERALPNLAVLSYAEVAGQAEVRAVASVRADDAH